MFKKEDLQCLDRKYFEILQESGYHITMESNLTGHIWDIAWRENPTGKSFVISHKHKASDPFHLQPRMHPKTVEEAQEMIKDHDRWVLEKKKNKK